MAGFQGNLRQKTFVLEYLKDYNATEAAKRAGYSAKTAYSIGQENLKKPAIAEEIEKQYSYLETKALVTREKVIHELMDVYTKCMTPSPVYGRSGDVVREVIYPAAAIKAMELIGKNLGMFREQIDIEVNEKEKRAERFADVDRTRVIEFLRRKSA